jgi:hypothetical protein
MNTPDKDDLPEPTTWQLMRELRDALDMPTSYLDGRSGIEKWQEALAHIAELRARAERAEKHCAAFVDAWCSGVINELQIDTAIAAAKGAT